MLGMVAKLAGALASGIRLLRRELDRAVAARLLENVQRPEVLGHDDTPCAA